MTTNHTHETPPPGSESASGQRTELDGDDHTTTLTTLQHRIGHIRLKARVPGQLIALQIIGPVAAVLLTIEEARQLIGALASLIGDIEADTRARDWSRRKLAEIIAQADASAESYNSKL